MRTAPDLIMKRARHLYDLADYVEMIDILSVLPRQHLAEDPELGMLTVNALRRLQRMGDALELLLFLEGPIRNSGNPNLVRRWQIGYAVYLRHQGRLSESMNVLTDTLSLAEAAEDFRSIAFACNGIGIASLNIGDLENAVRHWLRAVVAWTSIGDHGGVGLGHYNLAIAFREAGRIAEAFSHYALAQEYLDKYGTSEEKILLAIERALLLTASRDVRQAERAARAAWVRGRRILNDDLIYYAERVMGFIFLERDQIEKGVAVLEKVVEYWAKRPNKALEAEINEDLAVAANWRGQHDVMRQRRDAALDYYDTIGAKQRKIRLLERLERPQNVVSSQY